MLLFHGTVEPFIESIFTYGLLPPNSNDRSSGWTKALSGLGQNACVFASTSPVAGYNIYRATQPSGPYFRVNLKVQPGTTYLDTTVQAGVSYYYVVVAVADSGIESRYSNEVVAAIPWP